MNKFIYKQFDEGTHECIIRSFDEAVGSYKPVVMWLPVICESIQTRECIKVFVPVNLETLGLLRASESFFIGRVVKVKVKHNDNGDGTIKQLTYFKWPRVEPKGQIDG